MGAVIKICIKYPGVGLERTMGVVIETCVKCPRRVT
jgi:hypothetical protein